MPGCSGEPVVTTSCAFLFLHARLRVQRAPGIPWPSLSRAVDAKLGRIAPRERGGVCLDWLFEISRHGAWRRSVASHGRSICGSSWPGLSRPSTSFVDGPRTWMPGTRPGMTVLRIGARRGVSAVIASAAKRSSFVFRLTMDCFAALAMTRKERCELGCLTSESHERSASRSLIQLLAAFLRVEKRAGLAVEKLHVSRDRAAGRGVAGYGAGADREQLHVRDILAGLLRFELGIKQVLGAGQDQCSRLDRCQRLCGVAVKARRGADIVPLIGPGLVNPVVGVER